MHYYTILFSKEFRTRDEINKLMAPYHCSNEESKFKYDGFDIGVPFLMDQ